MAGMQTLVEGLRSPSQDGGTLLSMRHSSFTGRRPAIRTARDGTGRWPLIPGAWIPLAAAGDADAPRRPRSTYARTARVNWPRRASPGALQPLRSARRDPRRPSVRPHSGAARRRGSACSGRAQIPCAMSERPSTARPCRHHLRPRALRAVDPAPPTPTSTTMVRRFVLRYIFPRGEGSKPDAERDRRGAEGCRRSSRHSTPRARATTSCRPVGLDGRPVRRSNPRYVDGMPEGRTLPRVRAQSDALAGRVRERPELPTAPANLRALGPYGPRRSGR